MNMEKEKFLQFPGEIRKGLEGTYTENVIFNAEYTDALFEKPVTDFIPLIAGELTDNCMEKKAKNITITLGDNFLRVEDDVVEENPQKTLALLNNILKTGKGKTTKDRMRVGAGCSPGGGMGIADIVCGALKKVGGELKYFEKDGRIIAEASWK